MKTPEDYRRDDVRKVFTKRLGDNLVILKPDSITVSECSGRAETLVDFSYTQTVNLSTNKYQFLETPGSGFVDAVYKVCYKNFIDDFSSLKNISLVDVIVKPIFAMSRTCAKTDATTDVVFRVKPKGRAIAEFSSRSSSIVYSSFESVLRAFEFYVNCDKAFTTLQMVLEDSRERNRQDIASGCISDLATLATVNDYA